MLRLRPYQKFSRLSSLHRWCGHLVYTFYCERCCQHYPDSVCRLTLEVQADWMPAGQPLHHCWPFSASKYNTINFTIKNCKAQIDERAIHHISPRLLDGRPFSLQFHTGCLPMHLIIDQQMVLFYKRVLNSSYVVLRILLCLKQRSVNSLIFTLVNKW